MVERSAVNPQGHLGAKPPAVLRNPSSHVRKLEASRSSYTVRPRQGDKQQLPGYNCLHERE